MTKPKVGPTGDFPRGKLNENDEGGLGIGIATRGNTVIIAFGKPITWIGMPRAEALELASKIKRAARTLPE